MGLFRKKTVLTPEVKVITPGDIILVGGGAYFVTSEELKQLPVKKIGEK